VRRYGDNGNPEDIDRCIACVSDSSGWHFYQCSRKRGHGPDGLYCKQHATILKAGRCLWVPQDEQ